MHRKRPRATKYNGPKVELRRVCCERKKKRKSNLFDCCLVADSVSIWFRSLATRPNVHMHLKPPVGSPMQASKEGSQADTFTNARPGPPAPTASLPPYLYTHFTARPPSSVHPPTPNPARSAVEEVGGHEQLQGDLGLQVEVGHLLGGVGVAHLLMGRDGTKRGSVW